MPEVYHRTLGGRVTLTEMRRDEIAAAIARCPWEWHTAPRGFAPWPDDLVRGVPVEPPSLADAMPRSPKMWDLAK
jgi:hypothetical protein